MFGFLRFFLATLVVVAHIWKPPFGLARAAGPAVFGFFILSGFIMAKILNERYYKKSSISHFYFNRFLRIYPTYWMVIFISAIAIVIVGQDKAELFNPRFALPNSISDFLANVSIFGLNGLGFRDIESPSLSPPARVLETELIFYLVLASGFARERLAYMWLAVSILLFFILKALQSTGLLQGGFSYSSVPYGSIAFSLGAVGYHLIQRFMSTSRISSRTIVLISFLGMVVMLVAIVFAPRIGGQIMFLGSALGTLVAILALSKLQPHGKTAKYDKFLGDISYPLYLSHYLIALVLAVMFGLEKGFELFLLTMIFAIGFCRLINIMVETPIEKIRTRIREAR